MPYRISSRISPAFQWRIVTPAPHGERFPFDAKGLRFETEDDARAAMRLLERANGAQFMIVHNPEEA